MADQEQGLNRRATEGPGAILRSGLQQIQDEHPIVPAGKKGVIVGVFDEHGAQIGGAYLSRKGWQLSGDLSVAIRNGKVKDPKARVMFTI